MAGISTSQEKTPPANMMAGHASADDVADAEIFRRAVGADAAAFQPVLRADVGLVVRLRGQSAKRFSF